MVYIEQAKDWYKEDVDIPYFYNYVFSRYLLYTKGFELTTDDKAIYYKLRHNLYKSFCLFHLELPNRVEESFSKFGIESDRTPDFLQVSNEEIVLIEFTVCNKRETVVKVKESLNKYAYERELFKQKYPNKQYREFYLFLALDDSSLDSFYDIQATATSLGVSLEPDTMSRFKELKDEINNMTTQVMLQMPDLLAFSEQEVYVNLKTPSIIMPKVETLMFDKVEINLKPMVRRNNFYMKIVLSNKAGLRRQLMGAGSRVKMKIIVNVATRKAYSTVDKDGLSKVQLTDFLDTNSEILLNYLIIYNDIVINENYFARHAFDSEITSESHYRKKALRLDEKAYSIRLNKALHIASTKTLAECNLADQVNQFAEIYKIERDKKHKEEIVIFRPKNPFIYPAAFNLEYGQFNRDFKSKSPFMMKLFDLVKKKGFDKVSLETTIQSDLDLIKMDKLIKEMSVIYKKLNNSFDSFTQVKRMGPKQFKNYCSTNPVKQEDQELMLQWFEKKRQYNQFKNESPRSFYLNRVRVQLKASKDEWENEKSHLNRKKGSVHCYKHSDINELETYKTFIHEMMSQVPSRCPDAVYIDTDPIGLELKKTVEEMKNIILEKEENFRHKNISHSLLLISRFCHSLMYYSNIKCNNDDFFFDNLGYQNVLLLVKGGKNIRSTKRSRMFKLIYPINSVVNKLFEGTSTEIFQLDQEIYASTPWRQLNIEYLKNGFEIYQNYSNYYISNQLDERIPDKQWDQFVAIKTLGLFSQKRKLEIWLSNFRYLYFNSFGTHTNLLELCKSMVEYDHDSLFYLLQEQLCKNYLKIYESAKSNLLYDVLFETVYQNFESCAERFEENLFFTKAPFNPVNEHLLNLRSVLETHKYFMETVGTTDPIEILNKTNVSIGPDYDKNLFSNDFNFDKNLCYLVGRFVSPIISNVYSMSDLKIKFNEELSKSFTHISTSKGMRRSEGKFGGSKGHDVVFEQLDPQPLIDLITNPPKDNREYRDAEAMVEKTIKDFIESKKEHQIEFDMKDKSQKKGSREIYVMSDSTKAMQQPIENFFKKLCSALPNELINKPSHVRPRLIHSKMFDHKDSEGGTVTTYCTLDCRKWAPRSNLWKYWFFVMGMEEILPPSFLDYFYKFWMLMFYKRIRIQSHYVEKLNKNKQTESLTNYLKKLNEEEYTLTMPYSFMMGIFNYLSSLLHAASQLYFADLAFYNLKVSMNLFAHSDDSGGTITSKSYETNLKAFRHYEIFQKGLNHLMSNKKSVLSKYSFEIISIMYINRHFLPMSHKFMTNIQFNPKGKGWQDDIGSSVSTVTQLHLNGCSLIQCYAAMLANNELHRKAYHLPRSKILSKLPLAFGGVIDMHPMHVIMLGSDCQELMLDLTENEQQREARIMLFHAISGDYIIGKGNSVNYTLHYHVRHPEQLELSMDQRQLLKAFSMLKNKTTLLDMARYYDSLYNVDYVYSLKNIDTNHLMLSTLFHKHSIVGGGLKYQLKDIVKALGSMITLSDKIGHTTINKVKSQLKVFSQSINYLKASEKIYIPMESFTRESTKTCKPVIYDTIVPLGLNVKLETIKDTLAYMSDERVSVAIKDMNKILKVKEFLSKSLPEMVEDIQKILSKYLMSDLEKTRTAYMFFPSNVNIDTTERFWTYSIMYTTFNKKISTKKPQFFSADNFKLEYQLIEANKHKSLIMKYIIDSKETISTSQIEKLCDHFKKCKTCSDKNVDDILELHKLKSETYYDKETNLTFAVYHTPQARGSNVYYGKSDFTIYTDVGLVTHRNMEGDVYTEWVCEDESYILKLYKLYKLFCQTRNIFHQSPSYDVATGINRRVGFNDQNNPYVMGHFATGMMLTNSSVQIKGYYKPLVSNSKNKIRCMDEPVDFIINNIKDVNKSFYDDHNLDPIRHILFAELLKIDKIKLIDNFLGSKIVQIMNNDEAYKSQRKIKDKFVYTGLLGSECSFTRSMCLSDASGTTSFKSSVNPYIPDPSLLEYQTSMKVPVMDLLGKVNLCRMTYSESISFEKLANGYETNDLDVENIRRVQNKLGLEATASALVLFKKIFQQMNYGQVLTVPSELNLACLTQLLTAIFECLKEEKKPSSSGYKFGLQSFSINLQLYLSNKYKRNLHMYDFLSKLLTAGLIRAKEDDPRKFFNILRENTYSAVLKIHPNFKADICSMLIGMINSVFDHRKDEFMNFLNNTRHMIKAKRFHTKLIKNLPEIDLPESDFFDQDPTVDYGAIYSTNELVIDTFAGNDEFDPDYVEGEDYHFRTYRGEEELSLYLTSREKMFDIYEYTLQKDFKSVTIYSAVGNVYIPWLGNCCYGYEEIQGLGFTKISWPGTQNQLQEQSFLNAKLKKVKAFQEFTDYSYEEMELDYSVKDEYNTLKQKLIELNIFDPKYLDILIKQKLSFDFDIAEMFKEISKVSKKMINDIMQNRNTTRRSKAILPGWSGISYDAKLNAELESLFGPNYVYMLSGQALITESTMKNIRRICSRLYSQVTRSHKNLIMFILSILQDSLIDSDSDSWFVDSIMSILDHLSDQYEGDLEDQYVSLVDESITITEDIGYEVDDLF